MIKPLRNGILFIFIDDVRQGQFQEKTKWGFDLLTNVDNSVKTARWARVVATGPDVEKIQNGNFVCLEPLMWTKGFKHEGVNIWKSDESKVIFVTPERPA